LLAPAASAGPADLAAPAGPADELAVAATEQVP